MRWKSEKTEESQICLKIIGNILTDEGRIVLRLVNAIVSEGDRLKWKWKERGNKGLPNGTFLARMMTIRQYHDLLRVIGHALPLHSRHGVRFSHPSKATNLPMSFSLMNFEIPLF